ncbi:MULTISPECIES: DUF805 domain-containing protein [Staphylococcus]|uniref:Uncharacterized membrane protein YhaH, DUF805 family n=2 Tax=Staphylococcus TaxID=1279 RepID=A0ABY1H3L1_9STAP|nr:MULTISPECIES: DUF805 domain-containing protein [Staphylococcus]ATH63602.1 hypothetical protein BJG87_11790 [Staphylococcus pasteuri]KKI55790.1 hypothetical protein UF70_2229 [Staphylococcus pasteuri]MBM6506258.1 DUF805 domain-containing protein [Staphylococcus pasteuri]MCF7599591.1 DUF805 domain-containing protein [Staphylococcus pasteuri]MDI3232044.1 DUF805 domain-containing protein [Staphylococcus pasteuri]
MYCPNCGNKLESNTRFCANCGTPINNDSSNQGYQENNYYNQTQSIQQTKSQKNPWELYVDAWKNAFNYQGITSRRGFWWTYLIHVIIGIVLTLFVLLIQATDSILELLLIGILYLPLVAISARRMRDTNKSIYWGIIPIVVQWFFQPVMVGDYLSGVMQIAVIPLTIVFIVFACQRTKNTENRERIN